MTELIKELSFFTTYNLTGKIHTEIIKYWEDKLKKFICRNAGCRGQKIQFC